MSAVITIQPIIVERVNKIYLTETYWHGAAFNLQLQDDLISHDIGERFSSQGKICQMLFKYFLQACYILLGIPYPRDH